MWEDYDLPTAVEIDGTLYDMRTDYRAILDIFKVFADPGLMEAEQWECALTIFYPEYQSIRDISKAIELANLFISGNRQDESESKNIQLLDWEKDFSIIAAPINRIMGQEIRQLPYLHWWTFLSAFMEIGECTFNTFVGIRSKKAKGEKLDKIEQKIYKDNRSRIDIKTKMDSQMQEILNDVLQANG